MANNDGGAAFPYDRSLVAGMAQTGMTLRDWFAGQALVGVLAKDEGLRLVSKVEAIDIVPLAASAAYELADAMLEARK